VLASILLAPSAAHAADVPTADAELHPLTVTAPQQITLGLLPKRLDITCSPASIQTGIDCGMADMCGLDPCLCGQPDEYGACACNGTRETLPSLSLASDDTNTVRIMRFGDGWWLVPWAVGSTEVVLRAGLPHHTGTDLSVAVTVDAPLPPVALYAGILLTLLALLIVMARFLCQHGQATGAAHRKSNTVAERQDFPDSRP
jgi:hypothetical protein